MRILRVAVLAAAGLIGAWLLAGWTADLGTRGEARVEEMVALGAAGTGTLLAAWYGLTAVVLLLAELAHLSRRTPGVAAALHAAVGRLGAPVLRRAAVAGIGAGLALGAAPASADPAPAAGWPVAAGFAAPAATAWPVAGTATPTAADDAVPHDLRPGLTSLAEDPAPIPTPGAAAPAATAGAPAPSGEAGGAGPTTLPTEPPAQRVTPTAPTERTARTAHDDGAEAPAEDQEQAMAPAAAAETAHVVRRGDSLWSIAAGHLGAGASDAQVAAEWPRWYQTNRAVIGADPDLIHPGQELLVPDPKDVP